MSSSTSSAAERSYYRIQGALLFSRYVQQRRQDMGLSVEQVAYEACIEVSEWCALEGGYVPADDDPVLRSIAETLEAHYLKISLYAEISRYNQRLPV